MGGKAILFLVIGFSTIFLIMEKNIGTASTRAVDNMAYYYDNMNVHNIAVSGANVAANQIFLDHAWTTGYNNVSYSGGSYSVTVNILDPVNNIRKITSVGYYDGYSDTVQVTLQPSSFSKYAYFSVNEGGSIYWITGDTVWGPFHTQDMLRIDGDPVFKGEVSTKNGMTQVRGSNPEFDAGYQSGVDNPIPDSGTTHLQSLADNGGVDFSGHDTVYVTFAGDSVKYKYSYSSPYTSVLGSTLAPNGAIFATGAVLRLQGTVKGQYSIGASQETKTVTTTTTHTNRRGKTKTKTTTTTYTVGGDVYLDGDVVYNTNPTSNPNSTDLLGIVAQNNVLITDNKVNKNNINIQAAIYAETGGFGAENYATRPVSGIINLTGGITQYNRQAVGTFGSWGIASGFSKRYHYDERLMTLTPPGYPKTGQFEIVSWYE
jgi:hypothetical protein